MLKETLVVIRRSVRRTDRLLIRWATVYTHAAGIVWSKSLAQTVIITVYVYTRIRICIQELKEVLSVSSFAFDNCELKKEKVQLKNR